MQPERNFKHTKGPWSLVEERDGIGGDSVITRKVCAEKAQFENLPARLRTGEVCLNSVVRDGKELYPSRPYDARLVSKAPELAENLAWLVGRVREMVLAARRVAYHGETAPLAFLSEWLYVNKRGVVMDENDVLATCERLLAELESDIAPGETVSDAKARYEEVARA